MIACLFLMGYDGPKGDSGGLRLEIQEWNVEQKELINNTGVLNVFCQ